MDAACPITQSLGARVTLMTVTDAEAFESATELWTLIAGAQPWESKGCFVISLSAALDGPWSIPGIRPLLWCLLG